METAKDYRDFLRGELERRLGNNSRYSLRAFARDLQIDASHLSGVLRGTHGISRAVARRMARKLSLTKGEATLFCELVEACHARSHVARRLARAKIDSRRPKVRTLSATDFGAIAEWYHLALRELCALPDFRPDVRWMARRLGLREAEVRGAWERLRRLDLVTQGKNGRWRAEDYVASTEGTPSAAIRRFHAQMLAKARVALETHPIAEKVFGSLILSMHSSQVKEARELLVEFRRDFERKLAQRRAELGLPEPDRVYCLSGYLFGLDQANQRGEAKP